MKCWREYSIEFVSFKEYILNFSESYHIYKVKFYEYATVVTLTNSWPMPLRT